jgi:hypothetical protein
MKGNIMLTLGLILEMCFEEEGGSGLASHLMAQFSSELLGGNKSIFPREITCQLNMT